MAGDVACGGQTSSLNKTIENYRQHVKAYIDSHQYLSALFWADKVVSMTDGNVQDVFLMAQCFLLTKQYHRAGHCIKSRGLDKIYPACMYLAAKCHYEAKEYQEALCVLETRFPDVQTGCDSKLDESNTFLLKNVSSSIKLLKGKIYEAMDNRTLAAVCFKEALIDDVYCYEAFESLVQHQMLSSEEEEELISQLPFSQQCSRCFDAEIVSFLYENKLKKYSQPCERVSSAVACLADNLDVIISDAERHYYNCNYEECFRITTRVLDKDPYHKECLPIHIACLVELKKTNSMFYLAHKLVDLYPDSVEYRVELNRLARCIATLTCRKATTLDRVFGPAWLAYGHSFAIENEHDQAMAAYFKASKLMKGCHLPLLYIGLEYGLTNNPKLAEKFFSQALAIAPEDPFVLHEMGVIAFQNQEWEVAEKYFREALEKVQLADHVMIAEKWEPLLNNLGHTCRKLKKYSEALEFHQQALILAPQNASTFTAIGYIHSLTGSSALAVDYFHKALGLRRDDTFSTGMLGNVIEQLMNDVNPCEGSFDDVPLFKLPALQTGHTSAPEGQTSTDMSITDADMDVTE